MKEEASFLILLILLQSNILPLFRYQQSSNPSKNKHITRRRSIIDMLQTSEFFPQIYDVVLADYDVSPSCRFSQWNSSHMVGSSHLVSSGSRLVGSSHMVDSRHIMDSGSQWVSSSHTMESRSRLVGSRHMIYSGSRLVGSSLMVGSSHMMDSTSQWVSSSHMMERRSRLKGSITWLATVAWTAGVDWWAAVTWWPAEVD